MYHLADNYNKYLFFDINFAIDNYNIIFLVIVYANLFYIIVYYFIVVIDLSPSIISVQNYNELTHNNYLVQLAQLFILVSTVLIIQLILILLVVMLIDVITK